MAKTKDASSKKVPALIAAAVVVLLGLVGGGAYAVTTGSLGLGNLFEEPEPAPIELSEKPLFKKLDKFVVSLLEDRRTRYMMLELSLVSHDPRMPEQADQMNTVIRNALLHYFHGKEFNVVRSELQDLKTLQDNLKNNLIAAAANYGETLAVEEILLTNVVVQ